MNFFDILLEGYEDGPLMEGKRTKPREIIEVFDKMNKSNYQDVITRLAGIRYENNSLNVKNLTIRKRGGNKLELSKELTRKKLNLIGQEIGTISIEIFKKKNKFYKLVYNQKTKKKEKVPVNDFKLSIYLYDKKNNNLERYELFNENRINWKQLVDVIGAILGFEYSSLDGKLKEAFLDFGLN